MNLIGAVESFVESLHAAVIVSRPMSRNAVVRIGRKVLQMVKVVQG